MQLLKPQDAVVAGADRAAQATVAALRAAGVRVVQASAVEGPAPGTACDLVVLGADASWDAPWVAALRARDVPVISELEWGYQQSLCLHLAVAGSNGKSCAASLIDHLLRHAQRRIGRAGGDQPPLVEVAPRTRDLDFLLEEVEPGGLPGIRYYRPVVAVLLNIVPAAHPTRPPGGSLATQFGRLFQNQQLFDWAVVQSEALAQLRSAGVEPPSKVVTFSANNRRADLTLDRGLLVSRLPDWTGPLLDMERCQVQGVHHAENLMAALAVGRVLRVPLDIMVEALTRHPPIRDCCEPVGDAGGVRFYNDAAGSNLDALQKAVLSMPGSAPDANVLLIAGGAATGSEFHDAGPLLSRRVRHAFLLGDAAARLRAAWSLFTPCTVVGSLLEAVERSAEIAVSGDIVLFSPACPCPGLSPSRQRRGEDFRQAVLATLSREQRKVADTASGAPIMTRPGERHDTTRFADAKRPDAPEQNPPATT